MVIAAKVATVCVVGAGYVGLPLSQAFARNYRVITFDINAEKVIDLTAKNTNPNHTFTTDPGQISEADFIFICVPTLLSESKQPDMSYLTAAGVCVGRHMKRGAIVILESSVFPGATEELLKPVLEEESGLECGKEFKIAYSPERINPGDDHHAVERVVKLVAACDEDALEQVADLYSRVTTRVYKCPNIRTAEAAKLVENTQRDVNIALMNELSILFHEMEINMGDVLEAAATKWNFQKLSPGMVGGHCIPVVPYFLVSKAEELGLRTDVILAGRSVNDHMPEHIAKLAIKSLTGTGKALERSNVLIMGCTYKENVADTRESPVKDVISILQGYGIKVSGYDPLVIDGAAEFGIEFVDSLGELPEVDCIILAVAHDCFKQAGHRCKEILKQGGTVIDVKGCLDTSEIQGSGIIYHRL